MTLAALVGLGPVLAVHVHGPVPVDVKLALSPKHIVVFEGVIVIGGVIPTDTVATADAVQVPAPDNTVYVVVAAGVTVTLAALAGAVPVLADQTKGPAPVDDKATLSPKQIVVLDGVIFIDGVKEIETVATAEAVQVPVPDKTVYVVVVEGVTVTFAALAGLVPVLAVQTKGPLPEDDKAWLCPKQIVDKDGVIAIDKDAEIETVATAEAVQVPVPDKTVYVVVVEGVTVTLATLAGLVPVLAVHTNGPAPLADKA